MQVRVHQIWTLEHNECNILCEFRLFSLTCTCILVPTGFRETFFNFLQPKMTDFAAAFLKICSDICGNFDSFAVKIYHRQHSSNIVIAFLTSRTIVGLQNKIWGHSAFKFYRRWHQHLTVKHPVKPNSTYTSRRCLLMSAFTYARHIF